MYKYFIIILSLLVINNGYGQDTRYGGAFLEIGVGARALAMGSVGICNAEDGSAFFWNPGNVAFKTNIQVSGMYASLFNSMENHSFANVVFPIIGGAIVGVSWIRLAVDDIPRYNDPDYYNFINNPTLREDDPGANGLTDPASGYFTNSNNAYFITFSKLFRWNADLGWQYFEFPVDIGYGINFKLIDINLDDKNASGVGIDAGIKSKIGLNDIFSEELYGNLEFGLSVQDLLRTRVSWDTDSKQQDVIDRSWRYGFAYIQPLNFISSRVSFEYNIWNKYGNQTHFGFEFLYKNALAVRLGNNDGHFTAGGGIKYWRVQLDYAYQNHDLGNSHRVGTVFYF